jgi:hypothetical protein
LREERNWSQEQISFESGSVGKAVVMGILRRGSETAKSKVKAKRIHRPTNMRM